MLTESVSRFVACADGRFRGPEIDVKCAIGKGGCKSVIEKFEGDGVSPIGVWSMLRVFWRKDRIDKPETPLPTVPIQKKFGWCDDPEHPQYNQLILLPFANSHETLWRDDRIYDIIVELDYNSSPIVSGKGSAIFMHIAKEDYSPTLGCVAISEPDLRRVLRESALGSTVEIRESSF